MQSNIAIHGDMSETSGDEMAGNCLKKIEWYLKTSIHGHPGEKKKEISAWWKNSREWILLRSRAVFAITSS